jgi:hypothetical protein
LARGLRSRPDEFPPACLGGAFGRDGAASLRKITDTSWVDGLLQYDQAPDDPGIAQSVGGRREHFESTSGQTGGSRALCASRCAGSMITLPVNRER